MDARRALLEGLIHHAPTFPPAELPAGEALAEDGRARSSADAWMLGPLVWPASRLGELDRYAGPLSVVLDAPLPEGATPDWVESRWPATPQFAGDVFVELPIDGELERNLERVKATGAFAKVRCGGERTPSPEELGRFVAACAVGGLAFKASAGLHRPVRSSGQHGFLNLLAAVLFPGKAQAALACLEPGAFALDADSFRWEGRRAEAPELALMRRERFRGFGSCSFAEPVDELRALGML